MESNAKNFDWILLKDKKPADGQEVIILEEVDEDRSYVRTAVYSASPRMFTYHVPEGESTKAVVAAGVRKWAMS